MRIAAMMGDETEYEKLAEWKAKSKSGGISSSSQKPKPATTTLQLCESHREREIERKERESVERRGALGGTLCFGLSLAAPT